MMFQGKLNRESTAFVLEDCTSLLGRI